MEKRARWIDFQKQKVLEHVNHLLAVKGWRIEVLYDDKADRAYDAYPVEVDAKKK